METLETLRADLNALRNDTDALRGYVSGLYMAVIALIQTHPHHADVNLAISLLKDARDAGQITIDLEGPAGRTHAEKLLASLLTVAPYKPGALQSQPGMKPR